jgi:hypothetical protein
MCCDGDVLRLGVLQDALTPVPPADTRGLHPAHGGRDAPPGRGIRLVDVDGAGADFGGQRPPPADILGPDRGVQAVLGVVGQGHRLGVRGHPIERDHRTEGLGVPALHCRGDPLEDGRFVHVGAEVRARPAAGEHPGPLGAGVLDVPGRGLQLGGRDQRPHVDAVVQAGAEPHGLHRLDEGRDEGVVDVLVHDEPFGADAELPGGGEAAADRALDRAGQGSASAATYREFLPPSSRLKETSRFDRPPRRPSGRWRWSR